MLLTHKQQHMVTKKGEIGSSFDFTMSAVGDKSSGRFIDTRLRAHDEVCEFCEHFSDVCIGDEFEGDVMSGTLALFWYMSHQYQGDVFLDCSRSDYHQYAEKFFHAIGVLDKSDASVDGLLGKLAVSAFAGTRFEVLVRETGGDGSPGIWFSEDKKPVGSESVSMVIEGLFMHYMPVFSHSCLLERLRFVGDLMSYKLWIVPETPGNFCGDSDIDIVAISEGVEGCVSVDDVDGSGESLVDDLDDYLGDVVEMPVFTVPVSCRDAIAKVSDLLGRSNAGFLPVIACSFDEVGDSVGYCYEELFDDTSLSVVRSYDRAEFFLTLDHYDWVNQRSVQFSRDAICQVYCVDLDGEKKILHAGMHNTSLNFWEVLRYYLVTANSLQVYMHFMPVHLLYANLPKMSKDALRIVLGLRGDGAEIVRFIGSKKNFQYVKKRHVIVFDDVTYDKMLRYGFSLTNIHYAHSSEAFFHDEYIVVGGRGVDDVSLGQFIRLCILLPRAKIRYAVIGKADLVYRLLVKEKVRYWFSDSDCD